MRLRILLLLVGLAVFTAAPPATGQNCEVMETTFTNKQNFYNPPAPCVRLAGASCGAHGSFVDVCNCSCRCDPGWAGVFCNITSASVSTPYGLSWTARRRLQASHGVRLNGTLADAAGGPVDEFTLEFWVQVNYDVRGYLDVSTPFFEFRDPIWKDLGAINSQDLTVGGSTTNGTMGYADYKRVLLGQNRVRLDANEMMHVAVVVKKLNSTAGEELYLMENYCNGVLEDQAIIKQFHRLDNRVMWFGGWQAGGYFDLVGNDRMYPWDVEALFYDELRVWKRPLSHAEILEGTKRKVTGNEADLILYLPFEDGGDFYMQNKVATANGWLGGVATSSSFSDGDQYFAGDDSSYIYPIFVPSQVRSFPNSAYRGLPSSIVFLAYKSQAVDDLTHLVGSAMVHVSGNRTILIGGASGIPAMADFVSLNSSSATTLFDSGSKKSWLLDIATGTWTALSADTTPLTAGLYFHTATPVDNGDRVVVIGGSAKVGQIYVLTTTGSPAWSVPSGAAQFIATVGPLVGHSASLVGEKIYIFGGASYSASGSPLVASNRMFILDVATFVVEEVVPAAGDPWPQARMFHNVLVHQSKNQLFIIGGVSDLNNSANLTKAWVFDIESRTFSEPAYPPGLVLPPNRLGTAAVQLGESTLLIFGGLRNMYDVKNWNPESVDTAFDYFIVVDVDVSKANSTQEVLNFRTIGYDVSDGAFPFHRFGHSMAFDYRAGGVWIHGGVHAAPRMDTFSPALTGVGGDTFAADSLLFTRVTCPRGWSKYTPGQGATTALDESMQLPCKICPPGFYQPFSIGERPGIQRLVCIGCPKGTYSSDSGSSACRPCPLGSYASAEKTTTCNLCPADLPRTENTGSISSESCLAPLISDNSNSAGAIAGALIAALAVLAIALTVGIIFYRRHKERTRLLQDQAEKTNLLLNINQDNYQFQFLKSDDLVLGDELGHGSFGTVYKGSYHGKDVAIKVSAPGNQQAVEDFLKEADVMMQIDPHPNVLGLVGICINGPSAMVVLEFANGGSLDKLLAKGHTFEENELRAFLTQVALGLKHLHDHNLIHRDLAARNILLIKDESGKLKPKIADFGMSRVVDASVEGGKTQTSFGPVPWMAPEAIGELRYSTASDIWSLGVTIWEIMTGIDPATQMELADLALAIRDNGYHPRIQAFFPTWLETVLNGCWAYSPTQRLTIEEIIRILDPNIQVATNAKRTARKKQVEQQQTPSQKQAAANATKNPDDDPQLVQEVEKLRRAIEEAEARNESLRQEIKALKKPQGQRAWARSVVPKDISNI